MVIDQLTRIEEYAARIPHLKEALTCLEQNKKAVAKLCQGGLTRE